MTTTATYVDLAEALQRRLERARPGERVVSEHELAAAEGISRPTARAALQELERRYVVRRSRGAGTFVNRRIDYVVSADAPPSFTRTVRRAGAEPGARLIGVDVVRAPSAVATQLELDRRAAVVRLRRTTTIDRAIAGEITTHLPAELVPGFSAIVRADDGELSVDALLRDRYGLCPERHWTRATFDVPPADVAGRLGLETAVPSWLVESVNRDAASGRPIESSRGWNRGDALRVVLEMGPRS